VANMLSACRQQSALGLSRARHLLKQHRSARNVLSAHASHHLLSLLFYAKPAMHSLHLINSCRDSRALAPRPATSCSN